MKLILNDGTEIEDGSAGSVRNSLWLTMPGKTMQEAAEIAFDAEKTAQITHEYGPMQDVYEGFTFCTRLMDENGYISVCLERR